MIMVPFRSTACVMVLLLCSAWLSTARLHSGGKVNAISALKASAATTTTTTTATDNYTKMNGTGAVDENLKKIMSSRKLLLGRNYCGSVKSAPANTECKKSKSKRLSDDEVDGGFVAFSADYRTPSHHPPKNN